MQGGGGAMPIRKKKFGVRLHEEFHAGETMPIRKEDQQDGILMPSDG